MEQFITSLLLTETLCLTVDTVETCMSSPHCSQLLRCHSRLGVSDISTKLMPFSLTLINNAIPIPTVTG